MSRPARLPGELAVVLAVTLSNEAKQSLRSNSHRIAN
jgi:hypothetical protein